MMPRKHTMSRARFWVCWFGTKPRTTGNGGTSLDIRNWILNMIIHYFAMDGHIGAKAKRSQAENARRHGDMQRAVDQEDAARALQARWARGRQ